MTTGPYILMYGSKTWTKNRWDENRISAAEIKITTGGYINLVYKRHLDIMHHTTNRGIGRKLKKINKKTTFFEFLISDPKDDDLSKYYKCWHET
jgi:hypothetical protein